MADKVLRAALVLDASGAKQSIDEISAAEKAMSDSGIVAASSLSNGFESLEDRVGKVFAKLSEGRAVSDSELSALAASFVALGDNVTKAFGSVEKAPAEIQKAMEVAEKQITAATKSTVTFRERTEELSKQLIRVGQDGVDGLKKVEKELTALDTAMSATEKAAQRVRDAEKETIEAIESGSPRAATAIERLRNTHILLGDAMEVVRKEGGTVTAQMQAEYQRVGVVIDQSTAKFRHLRDEMQEHRQELAEGGEQWLGLGNAINKALGPMGKYQAQTALYFAAFTEGYRTAHQAMQAIGTDFSEQDRIVDDAKGRLKNFFSAWADSEVEFSDDTHKMTASLRLTADEFKGLDVVEQRSGKTLDDYMSKREQLRVIGAAENKMMSAGVEIQTVYNAEKNAAGKSLEKLADAATRINPIIDLHAKLVKQGAEGERVWSDLHIQHGTTIEQLRTKLAALGINLDDVKKHFDDVKAAEDRAKAGHESWAKALGDADQKQRELTKTTADDAKVLADATTKRQAAQDDISRLTQMIADATRAYGAQSAEVTRLSAELEKAKSAFTDAEAAEKAAAQRTADHKKELAEASKEVATQKNEILGLVTSLDKEVRTREVLSDSEKQALERLKQLAMSSHDLYDANGQLDEQLQGMIQQYVQWSTATTQVTDAQGNLTESASIEQESARKDLEALGKAIEARIKERDAAVEATHTKQESTAATQAATEATTAHTAAAKQNTDAHIQWKDALNFHKLSAQEAADTMRSAKDRYDEAAASTDSLGKATDDVVGPLKSVTDAASGVSITVGQTADGVKSAAAAQSDLSSSLSSTTDALREQKTLLQEINDQLKQIPGNAERAAEAMKKASQAGMDDEGANSTPPKD